MRSYPAIDSLIEQCGLIDSKTCGGRDGAQRSIMLARLAIDRAQTRLSRYFGPLAEERATELLAELAEAQLAIEVCTALIAQAGGVSLKATGAA